MSVLFINIGFYFSLLIIVFVALQSIIFEHRMFLLTFFFLLFCFCTPCCDRISRSKSLPYWYFKLTQPIKTKPSDIVQHGPTDKRQAFFFWKVTEINRFSTPSDLSSCSKFFCFSIVFK